MLGSIFSSIGGAIGGIFGGGILSTIGRFAGKFLGNYLEREIIGPDENYHCQNAKESFNLTKASYGDAIPLIFGRTKVNGKIIWSSKIIQHRIDHEKHTYFSDTRQVKTINHHIEYEYYLSFAIAICEGEIKEIQRVWANGKLVNLHNYRCRIYNGNENQDQDTLIKEFHGDFTPAFRGLAYVVFENLPLADFNDMVPNFEFEVLRIPNLPHNMKSTVGVENIVKSMVLIPGSGEFIYDTLVQYKTITDGIGNVISKEPINMHNHYGIANAIHGLNQLQQTCQNIKWVALVSSWFGTDTDCSACSILPGVEYKDKNSSTTETWKVSHYTRDTARLIHKNNFDQINYGGSVNDASVIRYLQELKSRGIKVMFYPMIFLDVDKKPWRGRITGSPESVPHFFNKQDGYNNFILHYAHLVKNYVDAFIIGSELVGLTKIKHNNTFPAVVELIKLAKMVKQIMPNVKITYSADWSEYHHTEGGWYNLDELWASEYIDFIGIDSYFPITHTMSSNISNDEIIKGLSSGEGWDYYLDEGIQKPLNPAFAWKNIKYWWSNYHTNPDGNKTSWIPKMKKIWFTEFGFPSIDKSPNQPNVFFDPNSSDGGIPKYSLGNADFAIQRRAIRCFIEHWEKEEYIDNMFLWCWDARPYPAWPHTNAWNDGVLWRYGHWVNDKFGSTNLASIILEISNRCGMNLDHIDVSTIDQAVEGYIITNLLSCFDAINLLRVAYFFDIAIFRCNISFVKRGVLKFGEINSDYLAKTSEHSFFEITSVATENILDKISIFFILEGKSYQRSHISFNAETKSTKKIKAISIPIVMLREEAKRLAQMILQNASSENCIVHFKIPIYFGLILNPTHCIEINHINQNYKIRIVNIKWKDGMQEVIGIFDDQSSYNIPIEKENKKLEYKVEENKLIILDLPFSINGVNQSYIACYFQSNTSENLYAKLANNEKYHKLQILKTSQMGVVKSIKMSENANVFLIDEVSKITIKYKDFDLLAQNGWNLAICGKEIIRFCKWKKLGNDSFEIEHFIRGDYATEAFILSHKIGENFILLEHGYNLIKVSNKLDNSIIHFKAGDAMYENFIFHNKSQKDLPNFIAQNKNEYQRTEIW
jgi:hypothetical protein